MLEFSERSMQVQIDTSKCEGCKSKACVSACKKYARGLLSLDEKGRASVGNHTEQEVKRIGTECLACEYDCHFYGNGAIKITVPVTGLPEYLKKREKNS